MDTPARSREEIEEPLSTYWLKLHTKPNEASNLTWEPSPNPNVIPTNWEPKE